MQKGFAPILILIVLVVLAGVSGGAYYLVKSSNNRPELQPRVSGSPTAQLTQDKTPNWKTYTNDKFRYSIQYPENLKHSSRAYEGIGGTVTVDQWSDAEDTYSIRLFLYAEGVNSRLEFMLESQQEVNILLTGQNVKKLVSKDGTLIHIGPLKKNNQNYMFTYTSGIQKVNNDVFDQMLSTTKFSDSENAEKDLPQAIELGKIDLAKSLRVNESQIIVKKTEKAEWRNSGLGCPIAGQMYLQVITPGYKVIFSYNGKEYEYHTNSGSQFVKC